MAMIQVEKAEPDSGKFFVPTVPCDAIDSTKVSDPSYLSAILRTDEIFPSDCKVITKGAASSSDKTEDRKNLKISSMFKQLLAMPATKGAASSSDKSGAEHLNELQDLAKKRKEL